MKHLKISAVVALAMLASAGNVWAYKYKVIEQPLSRDLTAGWRPRTSALNDVGGSTVNEYINATSKSEVCGPVKCERMPLLPHHGTNTWSYAYGINDAGHVAGSTSDKGNERAVLLKDGELINLGTLADGEGFTSYASAVNNLGSVIGGSNAAGGSWRGFRWKDGVMTELPALDGGFGDANAINDKEQIAGTSYTAGGELHAAMWSGSSVIDLGTLGGDYSVAYAINRDGVVVGAAARPTGQRLRPFRYRDGVMEDLGALPTGDSGAALGINDAGEVVGLANIAPVKHHIDRGFLFDEQGMHDLNDLLRASDRKLYVIERADDINNHGDIAAQAVRKSDDLMVPVILKHID